MKMFRLPNDVSLEQDTARAGWVEAALSRAPWATAIHEPRPSC